MNGNLSKSAFFEGVGHFERKFQTEVDVAHQPLLMAENYTVFHKKWNRLYLFVQNKPVSVN